MEDIDITLTQKQANRVLEQGQYKQAIALYQQCIDAQPNCLTDYWYLGLAYLLQGDEAEAQGIWLSAVLERSPEAFDAGMAELLTILTDRAHRYLETHQAELAETIYWQILELDGTNPDIYYHLGHSLSEQGKYDEAISSWQTAVQLKPDFFNAHVHQGEVLQKLADFDGAIEAYQQALKQHTDEKIAYKLGLCFAKKNKIDEAIACLSQAIQIQANFAPAHSDLGYVLLAQGKLNEAICYLENGLNIIDDFSRAILDNRQISLSNQEIYVVLQNLLSRSRTPQLYEAFLKLVYLKYCNFQENLDRAIIENILKSDRPIQNLDQQIEPKQIQLQDSDDGGVEPPIGFYESTWDWAVANQLETSHYFPILPQTEIQITAPKTPDKSIHFSFRFGKTIQLPNSFVAILTNGRYWLNSAQTRSATIASDNRLLGDLSPESPILTPGHPDKHPSKHSVLSANQLPPVRQIDGTVAILSGLLNQVYFHWMFDVIPRLELLKQSGLNFNTVDWFVIENKTLFQKESIQTLNIPKSKIIEISKLTHIQANKLIVPSFPGTVAWMPKWTCQFLRERFLPPDTFRSNSQNKKIYISRNKASSRRILNEDELLKLLSQFGFINLVLESMSISEQASLFANARAIVAPHGSGLTNLVFCQPGTKLIEIFSPNYVYHCYWLVSNIMKLDYYYLLGETIPGYYLHQLIYPDNRHEDIWVDINRLTKILKFSQLDSN